MNIPRPEHPNPQFERENWQNLNGEWEFEFDFGTSGRDRKFYEREKLLAPQRGGNTYREYSEDDVAVLKKIVVLRKLERLKKIMKIRLTLQRHQMQQPEVKYQ